MEKNIKDKLDKLLAEGHIDKKEHGQMVSLISKKSPNKSNKRIIIISVFILILYSIFAAYQDYKMHKEIKDAQLLQYDLEQAIQKGELFNRP